MNSLDYLLAAKARMDFKLRTFRVGRNCWFTLTKSDTTGTGCNIYFDDNTGRAWRQTPKGDFPIYENGVDLDYMSSIMDAVIVWFLYPDEAIKILEGYTK